MATPKLERPLTLLWQGRVPLAILLLSFTALAWWWHSLRADSEVIVAERLEHKAGELTLKLTERMGATGRFCGAPPACSRPVMG